MYAFFIHKTKLVIKLDSKLTRKAQMATENDTYGKIFYLKPWLFIKFSQIYKQFDIIYL